MGDWRLVNYGETQCRPYPPASIATLANRSIYTMMLTIFLVAIAAAGAAIPPPPRVDLDYAVYEGVSNATTGLDIFKGSVALWQ